MADEQLVIDGEVELEAEDTPAEIASTLAKHCQHGFEYLASLAALVECKDDDDAWKKIELPEDARQFQADLFAIVRGIGNWGLKKLGEQELQKPTRRKG